VFVVGIEMCCLLLGFVVVCVGSICSICCCCSTGNSCCWRFGLIWEWLLLILVPLFCIGDLLLLALGAVVVIIVMLA